MQPHNAVSATDEGEAAHVWQGPMSCEGLFSLCLVHTWPVQATACSWSVLAGFIGMLHCLVGCRTTAHLSGISRRAIEQQGHSCGWD